MKMTMRLRIRTRSRAHTGMVQSTFLRRWFLVAAAALLLVLVAPTSRTVVSAQSTEASSSPSITGRNPSTANFADISYKQICPTTITSESSWQTGSQQGEAELIQPVVVLNDNTTKTIAFVVMPNAAGQDKDEEEDGDGEEEEGEGEEEEENRGGDRVLKTTTRRRIRESKKRRRRMEDSTRFSDAGSPVFADARAAGAAGNNSLEFEDGFSVASPTIDFLLPNEINGRTTISRPNNNKRYLEEQEHAQRQEQEQPTNNQPQQQKFIHFDNLTSTQQSEIFYVRKCFCPRPVGTDEVVQHFCNLQSSYCAVYDLPPGGDGDVVEGGNSSSSTPQTPPLLQGVHCYTVDMQLVVSRNAWPLVLLWYLALVLACCCSIHGFLAFECLRRVCVVGHSKYQDEFLQRMNISSSVSGGASTESEAESGGGGDHDDEGNGNGGGGENSRGDRQQQQARPPQVQEGPESPAVVLAHQQSTVQASGGEGGFFQYAQALGGNFFGTARQQRRLMFEYNLWLQGNWITRHEMREEQRQSELERVDQMLMLSGSEDDGNGDGDGGIELQEQRYERPHPRLELKVSRWKAVVAESSASTTTSTFNSNVVGDNEDVVQREVQEDTKVSSSTTTTGGIHVDENNTTCTDHEKTAAGNVGETPGATTSETCCTICLLNLEDGDRVGDLSCGHVFHVECLKQWSKRKNSCPLCAQPLGIVKTYDRPSTTFANSTLTMQSMPGTGTITNATMETNNNSTTAPPVGPSVDETINRRVQRSLRHQQRRSGQNSRSRRSSSSSINRGGGMAHSSNRSMEIRIHRAHELALDGQGHSLDPQALQRFGRPYSELNSMQLRVMRNERQQEERTQQQQLRRRESSNVI
mmetsp:Transcript_60422/g.148271  ORF Transcript_60422/g.148271 Transcript_60422/m.148271 type:complete len:864 (+) Transcript_60422:188-2779(+)